jgi:hypothetical protein
MSRFYLPLPVSVTVSIFTLSAFIFLTLTPNNPILFTVIPQHIIISGYITLLATLHSHFWYDVLPFRYDPYGLNNTFIIFDVSTYLNSWIYTIFSEDGVCGVKNLNTCVLCACCLITLSSGLFLCLLIYGLVQVIVLTLVVNFSIAILLLTTLELDLFSDT